MTMQTKLVGLLAAGILTATVGMVSVGTAGAQSVPIDEPPPTGQPPQSPVEPPTNEGNTANLGAAPSGATLPDTGTGFDAGSGNTTVLAAIAAVLGATGVASVGLARRKR
jgi:uncharacterized iron-regulated membrane protein